MSAVALTQRAGWSWPQERRRRLAIGAALAVAVPVAGYAAGGAANGSLTAALVVIVFAVPVAIWRSLRAGVVMTAIIALSVEQFRYDINGTGLDAFTDRIPVFGTLGDITGIAGLRGSPMDVLVVVLLVGWAFSRASSWTQAPRRSSLSIAVAAMVAIWIAAFVHGLVLGGDVNIAVFELRPFVYFGAMFVLTRGLLSDRQGLAALGWALVVSTGIKAIEGIIILVQIRGLQPPPEAILAHEESFFFGLFVAVTAALWLFQIRSRLRTVATVLLPIVVVADLGNSRRVAWLIIAVDLVVLLAAGWVAMPERRRTIRRIAVAGVAVLALYLPVFWNASGLLAQPARAVRTIVEPSVRDSSSDIYRVIEDADLGVNIKSAGPLGDGMGLPIDYSTYKIVNLTAADSFIDYIPHNGLLWVWLRAGPVGELLLWGVAAAAILTGTRLFRSSDKLRAVVGVIGVCTAAQWIILGYSDMGFYWFRVGIVTGCVFGALAVARRAEMIAESSQPARAA